MESRTTYLSEETLLWAKSLGRRPNTVLGPSVSNRSVFFKGSSTMREQRRIMAASPPVKKRTKSAKIGPRKKRRSEESKEDDAGDSDSEEMKTDDDEGELVMVEEEAEVEEGEAVIGRGGRRGAKVCGFSTWFELVANLNGRPRRKRRWQGSRKR